MLKATAEQTQQLYSSHREIPNLLRKYANTDNLILLQPCNNLKNFIWQVILERLVCYLQNNNALI